VIDLIHHMAFTVSDMERSLEFYRDLLGLNVFWDTADEGVRLEGPVADAVTQCPGTSQRVAYIQVGQDLMELVEYQPAGRPLVEHEASDVGSTHICFLTDDIEELHERLRDHEVVLHCAPQEIGETTVFYFRDPDGMVLEAMGGRPIV
jgi:glyoxylase I family protein